MINGIAGKPGGGKSYEAVKNHVIPALEQKRKVVTNLPLQIEHFESVYGAEIAELIEVVEYNFHEYGTTRPFSQAEDFLKYDDWKNEKGQGVFFVIDECHLSMPNGKVTPQTTALLEYLSMHRHYGHDILLITQNFKKVHRDIRDMVNLVYRAIKKSFNGQDSEYILKIHEGCTTTVVNTKERAYESHVFKFYKSHTMSNQSVVEATTQDITPWWKSGLMYGAMGMGGLFLLILIWFLTLVFGSDEPKEDTKPKINKSKEVERKSIPVESIEPRTRQSRAGTYVGANVGSNANIKPFKEPIKAPKQFSEYEDMVEKSKSFHPFYKVDLAVSGFAEDYNFKIVYFSARQNGQHVFTISNKDLALAGYSVKVLGECAVKISYFDYQDFLTCNSPIQSVAGTEQVASLN
jgi:zona occludens toxin